MSEISAVGNPYGINPYTGGGRIDPYAIFKLNFEALGGEKQVKHDKNFYFKGELEMNNGTFQIEEFISKPLKSLRQISSNFKVVYSSGDDGYNLWDAQDGDVLSLPDADSKERKIRRLWDEYAYTDPKNTEFTAVGTRKISVDGSNCYEIKIKNRTTDEVVTHYYDTESFLLKRETRELSGRKSETNFDDYRDVGKTKIAFYKEVTNLNTMSKSIYRWDKVEKGMYIPETRFMAPESRNDKTDLSALLNGKGTQVNLYA